MDVRLPTGNVHAEECGSGVPLVILHGGKLDHRHMMDGLEPVFESLSGWRRLYVDLPGHGLLVEFASLVDAVGCAVAWQTVVEEHEAGLSV